MRTLILTRGSPGAGKSTWIKENYLEEYTICPDQIRLMFQSPILLPDGNTSISMNNDKKVWKLLYELLEFRMNKGEFTVIDATFSKSSDFGEIKKLAKKYRYRIYCVDFTDVPIEVAKHQNKTRPLYKQVPDHVIDKMYARFNSNEKVPSGIKVIKPNELWDEISIRPQDFSHYNKIHHIGDIHGCFEPLWGYFKDGLKDDELYIFVGDYIDRGTKHLETLYFLYEIMDRPNVIFLEGNHEKHLRLWANDEASKIKSPEFLNYTKPQLKHTGVHHDLNKFKKLTHKFCDKLSQLTFYTYRGQRVLVTHGGLPYIPHSSHLPLISADQIIRGVGRYEDDIDTTFSNSTSEGIQIHGHRNLFKHPPLATKNSFNLEGGVEHGGELRVITLDEYGFEAIEIPNRVVADHILRDKKVTDVDVNFDNQTFLEELRKHEGVKEKKINHFISSFNFTRDVFYDKSWDSLNVKARGLFFNTDTSEIISRGYNKFWNINEREETKLDNLKHTLKFPVTVYQKENGFLGIVGYDSQTDQLIISSKSTIDRDHAKWFREQFLEKIAGKEEEIKQYLKEENLSILFEVIDPINDPHIIKYSEKHIVLLDLIKRTPKFEKLSYEELIRFADKYNFLYKIHDGCIDTYEKFLEWYDCVQSGYKMEGFVIEDSHGYMVKLKLPYYNYWKNMRQIKDRLVKGLPIDESKLEKKGFYEWMSSLPKSDLEKDIIYLRDRYENERWIDSY